MQDRTIAPTHSTLYKLDFPKAETHLLANSVPLYAINAGSQPIVKIEALFPQGGSYYEKKTATALLALKMLQEGTENFTSRQLSDHFAQYGAFIEKSPSFDIPSVTLYCLSKHLDKVLPYFAEVILAPTFPEADLKRLVHIQVQQMKLQNEKSNILASKKFRHLVFGNNNPYGKIIAKEDFEQIIRQDLIAFQRENLSGIEILVSGQADQHTLHSISKYFGKTPVKTKLDAEIKESTLNETESLINEPKENALQSSIRIGKEVILKSHPDYIKLLVANHVLGGYFGSRLMKNIREDKGYTYGINSSIVTLKHHSYFVVSTDVQKEFVDDAINEIEKEIVKLGSEPIDAKELATVKNQMFGHFQSELTSAFSLAEKFKNIHTHGLGYSYYNEYVDTLASITSLEILSIFKKYLQPELMKKVIIG